MLALFFKFNRFWSFRNFDLILIILLAPGLLMVHYGTIKQDQLDRGALVGNAIVDGASDVAPAPESAGVPEASSPSSQVGGEEQAKEEAEVDGANPLTIFQKLQRYGYIWLFVVGLAWLVRLFYDPLLIRKPMLEPNLSVGGLVFMACSLTIFLFANVAMSQPENLAGPRGAVNLVNRNAQEAGDQLQEYGPGYPLLHIIPAIQTFRDINGADGQNEAIQQTQLVEVARVMAILSQIGIVLGLVYIGHAHFGSFQMGVAMATIFLMLPYTAQFAGDSMHLLPGALLVWAVANFHRPVSAGMLVGIAAGVCYYPLFLLPLWISFYWERGRYRFLLGVLIAVALVVSSLILTSADLNGFWAQIKSIFGFMWPRQDGLGGIWALNWEKSFRLPFLVGFVVLCVSYAFWPVKKDLASLISCTAAAMVAVQYWHGNGGGLYMAWYMPLVLLIIFRPNLDHQVAVSVIAETQKKGGSGKDGDGLDYAA